MDKNQLRIADREAMGCVVHYDEQTKKWVGIIEGFERHEWTYENGIPSAVVITALYEEEEEVEEEVENECPYCRNYCARCVL